MLQALFIASISACPSALCAFSLRFRPSPTITPSFAGTAATLSHSVTQPTFTGSFNNSSIAGTIGGSQSVGNHSHTYVALKAHTHAITYTETGVTGDVSVPIPAHTHTVTIGSHSHTLNSHTHTQK